jgi:hypothetical protein
LRVEEDLDIHSAGGDLRVVTSRADILEYRIDGGVERGVIGSESGQEKYDGRTNQTGDRPGAHLCELL